MQIISENVSLLTVAGASVGLNLQGLSQKLPLLLVRGYYD
jgi:hypothetical protein